MKKINNFKVYFSQILKDKYYLNKEELIEFWQNKTKQEDFNNKKLIGTTVGISELIIASSLGIIQQLNNTNLVIPVIVLGSIGALTTKISVTRENPYYLTKYMKIENDYQLEKIKYKKQYKTR